MTTGLDGVDFCDPAEQPDNPEEITFCDPTKDPQDDRLVFCNTCGSDVAELQIAGDEAPTVGSSYSASGGKTPYTWSISAGSINNLGEITDLTGACGTGTVSVTDACGTTASMTVRFPTGQWVYQGRSFCNYPEPTCGGYYDYQYYYEKTDGGSKRKVMYCCKSTSSPYGFSCGYCDPCCTYCTVASLDSGFTSSYLKEHIWKGAYYWYTDEWLWECP